MLFGWMNAAPPTAAGLNMKELEAYPGVNIPPPLHDDAGLGSVDIENIDCYCG